MLNIANKDLEIDLMEVANYRTHHTGDPNYKGEKARPIIAKFFRYYNRQDVFSKKND